MTDTTKAPWQANLEGEILAFVTLKSSALYTEIREELMRGWDLSASQVQERLKAMVAEGLLKKYHSLYSVNK